MNIIFFQTSLAILILISPCVWLLYKVYKNVKYGPTDDVTKIRLIKEIEMIEGMGKWNQK